MSNFERAVPGRANYEMEIIPLVQEYCFDDNNQLADIVGAGFVDAERMNIKLEIYYGPIDVFIAEMIKHFKR